MVTVNHPIDLYYMAISVVVHLVTKYLHAEYMYLCNSDDGNKTSEISLSIHFWISLGTSSSDFKLVLVSLSIFVLSSITFCMLEHLNETTRQIQSVYYGTICISYCQKQHH